MWNQTKQYNKPLGQTCYPPPQISMTVTVDNSSTLAQSRTDNIISPDPSHIIEVTGLGTERGETDILKNRAKRKMITQALVLNLIDAAKAKGAYDRVKLYWNAYHCQSEIFTSDGWVYSNYCKTRYCMVCNANRKADMINTWIPEIMKWEAPHFVTVTVKSVKAHKLNKWIGQGMIQNMRLIIEMLQKRHKRGKGINMVGTKSLECNFNPYKRWYNPHYHLIVANQEMAETLIYEWMKKWGKKHTNAKGQDMSRVRGVDSVLKEIIKYGSEIIREPGTIKKGERISPMIYANVLDNIVAAFQGHRLFGRFGCNRPSRGKIFIPPTQLRQHHEWSYDRQTCDWVHSITGEHLTGYTPNSQLKHMISHNINTELA